MHKPYWMVVDRIMLEQVILEGGLESLPMRTATPALKFIACCAQVHEVSRLTSLLWDSGCHLLSSSL